MAGDKDRFTVPLVKIALTPDSDPRAVLLDQTCV